MVKAYPLPQFVKFNCVVLGKFVTDVDDAWLQRGQLEEVEGCYIYIYVEVDSFHELVAIVGMQLLEVKFVPESRRELYSIKGNVHVT